MTGLPALEVHRSLRTLRAVLAMLVVVAVALAGFAFVAPTTKLAIVSAALGAVSAAAAVAPLWVQRRGPAVLFTITDDGLTTERDGLVPWEQIAELRVFEAPTGAAFGVALRGRAERHWPIDTLDPGLEEVLRAIAARAGSRMPRLETA